MIELLPILDSETKNPSTWIRLIDHSGLVWDFRYVYYNSRYFGGTRDEYRMTHMTDFFKHHGLKSGDVLVLRRTDKWFIDYVRSEDVGSEIAEGSWQIGSV